MHRVARRVPSNQIAVAEDFELPQISDEDLKKMQQPQGMPGGEGGAGMESMLRDPAEGRYVDEKYATLPASRLRAPAPDAK